MQAQAGARERRIRSNSRQPQEPAEANERKPRNGSTPSVASSISTRTTAGSEPLVRIRESARDCVRERRQTGVLCGLRFDTEGVRNVPNLDAVAIAPHGLDYALPPGADAVRHDLAAVEHDPGIVAVAGHRWIGASDRRPGRAGGSSTQPQRTMTLFERRLSSSDMSESPHSPDTGPKYRQSPVPRRTGAYRSSRRIDRQSLRGRAGPWRPVAGRPGRRRVVGAILTWRLGISARSCDRSPPSMMRNRLVSQRSRPPCCPRPYASIHDSAAADFGRFAAPTIAASRKRSRQRPERLCAEARKAPAVHAYATIHAFVPRRAWKDLTSGFGPSGRPDSQCPPSTSRSAKKTR